MLRTRHAVLLSMAGLCTLACAARPAEEPASPAGGAPETPAQQPSYPAAPPPQSQPVPQPGTPGSGEGGSGLDATPRTRDEEQYSSIAEAEAALEQARAELNPPPARGKPSDPAPNTRPSPKKPSPSGGAPLELAQGSERCVNACKAFASLKRAASAVCRLAGESNTRCKRAQTIVQENEARVSVCKCSQNGD